MKTVPTRMKPTLLSAVSLRRGKVTRMTLKNKVLAIVAVIAFSACSSVFAGKENSVVGTWRMISATVESQGIKSNAYGPDPHGWLVFTPELTFVEVLTDPRVPAFRSNVRGEGTDEENRAAMAGASVFSGDIRSTRTVSSRATLSKGLRSRTGWALCAPGTTCS